MSQESLCRGQFGEHGVGERRPGGGRPFAEVQIGLGHAGTPRVRVHQQEGAGLNITVMSYRGSIDVGIVADRDQVPDVHTIVDHLREELAVLKRAAA
jgi:hypothetical protein